MSGIIKDHRREARPEGYYAWGFVVFTDKFMSGWGQAPGRSLYALEVTSPQEAELVLANGKNRTEMKRGRIVKTLKGIKLRKGDHLSVTDKFNAERWFEVNGFAEVKS